LASRACAHVSQTFNASPRSKRFAEVSAYLFPGLHPDGFEDAASGWPRALKRFAAEAWRRAGVGELTDEELYPSDAQWSGLYDRMHTHEADEVERRLALAMEHGDGFAE
jgi:hypothetical protein